MGTHRIVTRLIAKQKAQHAASSHRKRPNKTGDRASGLLSPLGPSRVGVAPP